MGVLLPPDKKAASPLMADSIGILKAHTEKGEGQSHLIARCIGCNLSRLHALLGALNQTELEIPTFMTVSVRSFRP